MRFWTYANDEIQLETSDDDFPLLDWCGLRDKNGVEIPYSRDKAIEILNENPDLFYFIITQLASAVAEKNYAKEVSQCPT